MIASGAALLTGAGASSPAPQAAQGGSNPASGEGRSYADFAASAANDNATPSSGGSASTQASGAASQSAANSNAARLAAHRQARADRDTADATAPDEASSTPPATTPPAADAATIPVATAPKDDTGTAATAPGDAQQLLALLAGSLAIAAPAQPVADTPTLPAADTSATGAGKGAAAALIAGNTAGALQQSPGLVSTGALAALLDPKAATDAAPTDALKLAFGAALERDDGDGLALPDGKDDKPGTLAFGGLVSTTTTLDRPLTTNAVTATPVNMPAHLDDGFDDGFGTRIAWMAEQKLGHAEIRLNPENAGPIDVRIQLDGTQVNAAFHSANADVRQALEASLPRLRDLLGQQGLQLGNTDIGQRQQSGQSSSQNSSGQPQGFAGSGDAFGNGSASSSATVAPAIVRSRGLLDEYA